MRGGITLKLLVNNIQWYFVVVSELTMLLGCCLELVSL